MAAAAIAAVTAAGCGSTVEAGRGTTPGLNGANSGLSVASPGGSAVGPGGQPLAGGSGAGGVGASGGSAAGGAPGSAGTTGQGGGSLGGPATGGQAAATSGPGFTADKVYIGVAYDSTYSQELGQAGVSSGSTTVGDQKQQVTAMVDDINARGGVLGRKMVPVFFDTKGLNSQNDPATLAQSACAAWTEDQRVFAAMTFVVQMDNPALYGCLAKHQVIFVPFGGDSQATMQKYSPYLWGPPAMTPERLVPIWIQRLKAIGYFSGWNTTTGAAGPAPVKIGLLYGDGLRNGEPSLDDAFVKAVNAALAKIGMKVTDAEQISNSQSDEASAVLKFNSDHVTHVIGDYSLVNFTTSAESQQYRPRYGYTTLGGGVALDLFATKDQLNGALGVGWVPSADVENGQDPGDVSPAEAHCRSIMTKAQQPTTTRLAWFAMTQACDTFNFLALAIARSGFAVANFRAAVASLGSMQPVSTFEISFPGARPDGAGAVRDVGYNSGCGCFAYLSKTNHPA